METIYDPEKEVQVTNLNMDRLHDISHELFCDNYVAPNERVICGRISHENLIDFMKNLREASMHCLEIGDEMLPPIPEDTHTIVHIPHIAKFEFIVDSALTGPISYFKRK